MPGKSGAFVFAELAQFGDEVFAELVFDAAGKAGGGEFAGAEGA